jgi:hypothetical protein
MSKHFVSQRRLTVLVRLVDEKSIIPIDLFSRYFFKTKKRIDKIREKEFYLFFLPETKNCILSFQFQDWSFNKTRIDFQKNVTQSQYQTKSN